MKKLNTVLLALIALFLGARFFQELHVNAQVKVAKENGDVNGDGKRDLSDAIYMLSWLFQGGSAPVAMAQDGGALTPEQAEILSHMSIVQLPDGQGGTLKTIRISGVNLQLVNGNDKSATGVINGLGNLTIGYNEGGRVPQDVRTGSHNLILGVNNNYASYGGIVAGGSNSIEAGCASVLGGTANRAIGDYSIVSGGIANNASGENSSILGGDTNYSQGKNSTVSGGYYNVAKGTAASVGGGSWNNVNGEYSLISGGYKNTIAESASYSSISGGKGGVVSGSYSAISGGYSNQANGNYSSVAGGTGCVSSQDYRTTIGILEITGNK